MDLHFYNTKFNIEKIKIGYTTEEFVTTMMKYKPTEIFCPQWSMEKPMYILSNYTDDKMVDIYASNSIIKTPEKRELSQVWKSLNISGIYNFLIKVSDEEIKDKNHETLKDLILSESGKGNIVVSGWDGLSTCAVKEAVKQPIEGLLYDLNRDEATILTFINEAKWVNDYACAQVIRELKRQLDEKKHGENCGDLDTACPDCLEQFETWKKERKNK